MPTQTPKWIPTLLYLAAAYNILWGIWVIAFPEALFQILEIESPRYIPIWQALGMVVGVYGVGYAIAASNPYRHWPIVLVGLIGKILGPLGLAISLWSGSLPPGFFWQILLNDLVWWVPFSLILLQTVQFHSAPAYLRKRWEFNSADSRDWESSMNAFQSQMGLTIPQISDGRPLMLIFLRQGGCTFCRQTLADLRQGRDEILKAGIEVALVHQGSPMEGTLMLSKYDLDFFHRFSDPECELYHLFGFQRGNLKQVLSPHVLWAGLKAAFLNGHGMGAIKGDSFQLPGVIVIYKGDVLLAFPAKEASERFDYLDIVKRTVSIQRKFHLLGTNKKAVSLKT